jgi:hypothetical protein
MLYKRGNQNLRIIRCRPPYEMRRSLQQDVLGEIPNNEAMKVYGFVRVPKTGSTCTFDFVLWHDFHHHHVWLLTSHVALLTCCSHYQH